MKKILYFLLCSVAFFGLVGCESQNKTPKIGISFGVGPATRWVEERGYMEERAKELGADVEIRFNTTDKPKTQTEDCIELIDSGIDVLLIIPRDINNTKEVVDYAKKKNVPIISYARLILNEKIDFFVGYDSKRIGQQQGQYLAETVYTGDYILLKGDPGDYNAVLIYDGAMIPLANIREDINIILDTYIAGWSPEIAKEEVKKAVMANNNKVDAILAPNDKLAGASLEALQELGITNKVIITGMDAELDAIQRVAQGTQACTLYMDLKALSRTAVTEAYNMAMKKTVNINGEFDNQSGSPIPANLITGQLITKENLDRILIDTGIFTHEEVYGTTD